MLKFFKSSYFPNYTMDFVIFGMMIDTVPSYIQQYLAHAYDLKIKVIA